MHIGTAIRHTRERLGLKLEAVAIEAGFDAGNLSRIETGKQKPSIPRLEGIARAMNVRVADLYTLVEPLPAETSLSQLRDVDEIVYGDDLSVPRSYLALNAQHRKLVHEFVKMLGQIQKDEESRPALK
jgi:transcriptional regulator with XRE-family HTH domain